MDIRYIVWNEATFIANFPALRKAGITPSATPSGMHNKVVEIKIKELKSKVRCMKAELKYVLFGRLVGELVTACSILINCVPNARTGPNRTPYQVITGKKPIIQPYKFGEIGQVESMRQDEKEHTTDYAIYLYNMYNLDKSYKVYVPSRNFIYSKRVFVPTKGFPASWGLKQRLRKLMYFDNEMEDTDKAFGNDVVDYAFASQDNLVQPDSESIGNRNVMVNSMYDDINYAKTLQGDVNDVYNTMEQHSGTIEMIDDELMATRMVNDNATAAIHVDEDNNPMGIMMEGDDIDGIVDIDDIDTSEVSENTGKETTRRTRSQGIGVSEPDLYSGRKSNEVKRLESSLIGYTSKRSSYARGIAYRAYVTKKTNDLAERKAYQARLKIANNEDPIMLAYRVSLKKATSDPNEQRRKSAEEAIIEEIDNLFNMGWGDAVMLNSLSREERDGIIHAFMFLKEKTLGDGTFDKWKARLVAGGNEIKDTVEQDTYSPTANYISVMSTIALAASEKSDIRSYDVKGAYLIPDIKRGEKAIIIRLDRELTTRIVDRFPHLAKFVDINGCMFIRLKKYLYGLPMAGKHWNEHISMTFNQLRF